VFVRCGAMRKRAKPPPDTLRHAAEAERATR
jgi:hypothetical protein